MSLHMTKQRDAPEWEKKKYVKLIEVHLSPEINSLVAVKPAEGECPKGDKFHPTEDEQEIVMATAVPHRARETVLAGSPSGRDRRTGCFAPPGLANLAQEAPAPGVAVLSVRPVSNSWRLIFPCR